MYKAFSGFVTINKKQYPYTFSEYNLIVEGDFSLYFDSEKKLNESLDGTITNEPCIVVFYIGTVNRVSFKSKGYASTSIHIPVRFFVVLEHEYNKNNVMLKFKNTSFSKWLGLVPIHRVEQKANSFEDKVIYQRALEKQSTSFCLDSKKFILLPTADVNYSNFDFRFFPSLTVKCMDLMEISDLLIVALIIIDFVRFCFFRKLVDVGDIEICCMFNENGVTGYRKVGSLNIKYNRKEIEPIDINSTTDYGFIPWSMISGFVPYLIDLIYQKKLYLEHLPEQRLDRFLVNHSSVSLDAASFEFEFKALFSKYETKKKVDKNYLTLRTKLENIGLTKECNGILKDFIAHYFDQPTLLEKIEYAITYYKDFMIPFFKKIGIKSVDSHKIAKDFKDCRNLVDHGSTNLHISSETARAALTIRAIVICMQLERIGMNFEQIGKVIKLLFD